MAKVESVTFLQFGSQEPEFGAETLEHGKLPYI
jgi:hypothetical protein